MAKPLNEFGGWLKFFYITLWIGLVLLAVYMLLLLPEFFEHQKWVVFYTLAFLVDCGLRGFLGYKIILATKKREASTPNRIMRLLTFILLVGFLLDFPKIYFARIVYGMPGVRGLVIALFELIIWFLVWTAYFRRSQRVIAYYGQAADKFF